MFINYEKSQVNLSKMTSYINLFLKTELTCIPKLLKNYLGNYYNNALCNGATWVFVLWCVLHIIFDKVVDAFLKKVRFKEYIRLRLRSSLWYLGFYGTALTYCGLTLAQNEIELFNFKRMHVPTRNDIPAQVMGYTLISTFYLHCAFWEGLMKESFISMFSYLFLFTFLVSSYILRIVEISFTLTALISLAQVTVEFTRCCFMNSNQESWISKIAIGILYLLTIVIYIMCYVIVIPMTFITPLGLKIMTDYPNILLLFLFFNLISWIVTEIYQSVLFKSIDHWLYHREGENYGKCNNGLIECSLFKPRDDISYNLHILRQEIKARETKMMSLRKPKNKGMLIQTLKCMVAIKRKLSEKRFSDSSDSDDSEKSEDSSLKTSEKTDDETIKPQSDGDDTGDEESESQESIIESDDIKQNNNDIKLEEYEKECVGEEVVELINLTEPDISSDPVCESKMETVEKSALMINEKLCEEEAAAGEKSDPNSLNKGNTETTVDSNVTSHLDEETDIIDKKNNSTN